MKDKVTPRVNKASRVSRWATPPGELSRRVRGLPRVTEPSPGPALDPEMIPWSPGDVRGDGPAGTPGARMTAHSFPAAEVGLLAIPPAADEGWRIEGRVWLAVPSDIPIRVLLVHDDHVLAESSLSDGGKFRIEEVVGSGWKLEIHLPGGETLMLEEPRA